MSGGAWLLSDMGLILCAQSIVKHLGLEYSSGQLVFFRALTGLVVMLPWILVSAKSFRRVDRLPLHLMRVGASTIALTAGFYAIARLPLALITVVNFTRPILTMVMAVVILREMIGPRRWIAAAIAFAGVFVAVSPGSLAFSWALLALLCAAFFGTGAIIITRLLNDVPTVVMMTFYTAGLTLLVLPLALRSWTPVDQADIAPLLAIGICAQVAQLCFLKAHRLASAGFLSVLSYLSLPLSASVGYFVFGEVLSFEFLAGAALIMASTLWTVRRQMS
ncbi:DMT family transporter [uncultured Roseibium sp.]|uniref:DMT family transporter n=1 Tax=uncultured Roseibium sp. TaxID=1936171 RepID=UPI002616D2DC|nr:DMT family transporter [uncultured Roseibium sp.]